MSRSGMPRLLSLLYNHNPFYLISTCLFVYGLKLLFRTGEAAVLFERGSVGYMEPWGLMTAFAAVTLLMAATAILIVRLGKVWEDARSLILIVLLMLLAVSVSFDEIITLLSDRDHSRRHLLMMFGAGVCFAVGLCEALIRGLRIRLIVEYRLPLHGFLALFFLWPALLLPELTGFTKETVRWLIAAFPLAAGLLTLTLIPAVRRDSAAVSSNGTPWSWPLFPWTPFVFLAVAVCFRAYSLTMSFDPLMATAHYWDTMFGVYLLVPFLAAVLVILLEISVAENKPALQRFVILTAPLLLLPACPWLVPWHRLSAYSTFTQAVIDRGASPVYLTLISLAAFYGYAWSRRVRSAEVGFYAMALLCCVLDSDAFGTPPGRLPLLHLTWWPLSLLSSLQLVLGFRRGSSGRFFTGLMLGLLSAGIVSAMRPELRPWLPIVSLHGVFLCALLTGSLFRDRFAELVRRLGPPGLSVTVLLGVFLLRDLGFGVATAGCYVFASILLSVALSFYTHNRYYLMTALIHGLLIVTGGMVFAVSRFVLTVLPQGVKPLVLATGSFIIAVLISLLKSGLSRRIRMAWLSRHRIAGR